jgi:hypothetical protein
MKDYILERGERPLSSLFLKLAFNVHTRHSTSYSLDMDNLRRNRNWPECRMTTVQERTSDTTLQKQVYLQNIFQ